MFIRATPYHTKKETLTLDQEFSWLFSETAANHYLSMAKRQSYYSIVHRISIFICVYFKRTFFSLFFISFLFFCREKCPAPKDSKRTHSSARTLKHTHIHTYVHIDSHRHTTRKYMLENEINSSAKNLSPMAYCRDKLSDFDIELLLIECFWLCVSFMLSGLVNIVATSLCVASHIFQLRRSFHFGSRFSYTLIHYVLLLVWLAGGFVVFISVFLSFYSLFLLLSFSPYVSFPCLSFNDIKI